MNMALLGMGNIEREVGLILFDKDGTLLSLEVWQKIMHKRLSLFRERYGNEVANRIKTCLGFETEGFNLKKALYSTRMQTLSAIYNTLKGKISRDEINRIFTDVDRSLGQDIYTPINGAVDKLIQLNKAHVKIYIVTNDSEQRTRHIFSKFPVVIDGVIGSDTLDFAKPDSRVVSYIIDREKIDREHTIVVGDSIQDMELGKSASVFTVGVLSGLETKENLKMADILLESVGNIDIKGGF